MKRLHLYTIYSLLFVLTFSYLVLAVWFPHVYIRLTYEDLYGEWGQTYLFLIAGLYSARLALRSTGYRWFFVLLSLACLYTVLEEISWGQRLIGFESPYVFDQYNQQQETNIHNFLTGPFHTTSKNLVEAVMVIAFIGYGVLYPLLLNKRWSPALWLDGKGVAAPPMYLWPFFLLAAPLEIGLFHYNEAEVAELLIGSAVLIIAMHYWYAAKTRSAAYPQIAWTAITSRGFSKYLILSIAGVAIASISTTKLLLNNTESRARIENRIINGTEKFARRFENRGQWNKAAEFYRFVYDSDPSRISVLRKLVNSYQVLDDERNYRHFYRILLEKTLQPGAQQSPEVSVNLSLSRSYRKIGDKGMSEYYLKRAYQFAHQAVLQHPDKQQAVYELAMVHERAGRLPQAGEQYRRCVELDADNVVCQAGVRRVQKYTTQIEP